ncbi:MAG: hypothetical protein D6755_08930 [Anaerolineae bacterium]|nr:MAG: hypothetical protein D6755_08930 [Anaerolineae bacterium]
MASTWYYASPERPRLWRVTLAWLYRYWEPLTVAGLTALTLWMYLFRRHLTPDVHTDEYNYYRAGYNIWRFGSNAWPESGPITVHPPIYFLCEALLFSLVRTDVEGMYQGVYTARILNAIFATITALLVYLLARKLGGKRMAFLAMGVYMLDPFILRTNRRGMLETLTELWVVIAFLFFYLWHTHFTFRRQIALGVVMGLSLLTKELAIVSLVALYPFIALLPVNPLPARQALRHPLWRWVFVYWHDFKGIFSEKFALLKGLTLSFLVGLLMWTAFPIWAFSVGNGQRFLETKFSLLLRWSGKVQTTGWNRPGVSFLDPLLNNLRQYATSYILLGVGGLITLWLFFANRDTATRFLLAWAASLYATFAFVIVAGQNNDQYFYLLIIPSLLVVTYALERFMRQQKRMSPRWRWPVTIVVSVLCASFFAYNAYDWVHVYGVGVDNARWQLTQWVNDNIPPGETIGVGIRVTAYVQAMFPHNRVVTVINERQTRQMGIRYVVTGSKWLAYRFGDFEPSYYQWIEDYGKPLFSVYGPTAWRLTVYYLNY